MNFSQLKFPLLQLLMIGAFLSFCANLCAQVKPQEAHYYLDQLSSSKDTMFSKVLKKYNLYLESFPSDVEMSIERCKFIGEAYYDDYEDYNPKFEEYEECKAQLLIDFPTNAKVYMLELHDGYGEELIEYCEDIIRKNRLNELSLTNHELGLIYEVLATQQSYLEEASGALKNGLKAMELNDTLDLSLTLANQYIIKNSNEAAVNILISHLDSLDDSWELTQKGKLLLALDQNKEALKAYEWALRDTNIWIDNSDLSEVYQVNGRLNKARELIKQELDQPYNNKSASLQRLFEFDLLYSSKDSLVSTYKELKAENYWNDPVGVYRIIMVFKAPFQAWEREDIYRFFLLALCFIFIFIIPYIVILPIDFLSNEFNLRPQESILNFRWTLTHFWVVCSMAILLEFLLVLAIGYKDAIGEYFIEASFELSEFEYSKYLAHETVLYFLGMMCVVSCFMVKRDWALLKPGRWTFGNAIGNAVGMWVVLMMIWYVLRSVGLGGEDSIFSSGSVTDSVQAVNSIHSSWIGFLFIVIFVPLYEEYLFRGIILGSVEKRLKYSLAVALQAIMFALIHDNFNSVLFYIVFAICSANLAKRSGSLLSSFIFHALNNLVYFIYVAM